MKKWFIFGGIMIIAGLVLFGLAMIEMDLSFNTSDKQSIMATEDELEPFTNIRIESDTDDIYIIYNNGEGDKVLTPIRERAFYSITVEEDTLVIRMDDQRKWYDYISIFSDPEPISLYLSEKDYGDLCISADTADVVIEDSFTFASVDIAVTTGDIEYYPSATGDVSLRTSTGSIHADCEKANNMTVKVTTGDLFLENITCNGDLTHTSSTGDVELTNVQCQNMFTKGTTGKLTINGGSVSGKLTAERSTGDVTLHGFKAAEIEIETSTGDVRGTLLEAMDFRTETSSGSVNVPHSFTGGLCKITTSTGDIQLSIS